MESIIKNPETHAPYEKLVWRDIFVNSWSDDRRETAERHYENMKGKAQEDVDALVLIPVDAASESVETISHALEKYNYQTLRHDKWEMVLYLNRPNDVGEENHEKLLEAIERFQEDNINGPILHVVSHVYDEPVTMGRIRSDAADLAFMHEGEPWLMISHDIDLIDIDGEYLEKMRDAAQQEDHKLFFGTRIKFGSRSGEVTRESSIEERVVEFWSRMRAVEGEIDNYFGTTDANAGILLDAYAAYGGYSYDVDVRERSELGELKYRMLTIKRQVHGEGRTWTNRSVTGSIPDTFLVTNNRRVVETVRRGALPQRMTTVGEFSTDGNDMVRNGRVETGQALEFADGQCIVDELYREALAFYSQDSVAAQEFEQRVTEIRLDLNI